MDNLEEFKIPKEALEKLQNPELIRRQIAEGKTFQEIIGYSDATMDKFYGVAYHLFQVQQYEDAAEAFTFLTTLNPYVHNYWLGLGMSEHLIENYDAALTAYAMAILTNVENPIPHYHSASCYHMLNNATSAIASLELAIECAGDKAEHSKLKEQAKATLQSLKQK